MSLAAAHGLLELEDALRRLAFQPAKALIEQGLHAVGDEVLVEEFGRLDAIVDQVGQVQNRVAPLGIEDTFAWFTELLERFHSLLKPPAGTRRLMPILSVTVDAVKSPDRLFQP